ncbi:UDP-galactopyranose mutase [Kaistia soli DSM 19436]|uniref:UDP-galactopyranose mutase n=2 Tax=Kaistia TaxID=166953 RepID=A0A1M5Q070_9HYPH|nr:UDP-galactopyranose mutase [Kaistia soli DSM 19436]
MTALIKASDVVVANSPDTEPPLICLSHLRWDFVLQRPQHLMQRFAGNRRVFFFEEYIPTDHHLPYLEYHAFDGTEVVAVRPRVPHWWNEADRETALARLFDMLLKLNRISKPVLWFYTPMMFGMVRHVEPSAVVYDCMDELANFRFAPPQLQALEAELIERADVVFTGGQSLYEAKHHRHDNIHPFPSSVDLDHFGKARSGLPAAPDLAAIPGRLLGYYGVIDERLDLDLIASIAAARPDWSLVMVGPVAKLRAEDLPRAPNIHYLGARPYEDLPAYLAGWDVALMPFAINEATRFISPTKTPEYLAAGKPVVSTPVADVVRSYGDLAGVCIGGDAAAFVAGCEDALHLADKPAEWLPEVDAKLAGGSWDATFQRMDALLTEAVDRQKPGLPPPSFPAPLVGARRPPYDVLVVGAGFAGSVLAERLAADAGKRVLLCDRRPHVGGNAYDHLDEAGILVHRYGPHIFHSNSEAVVAYLSRFTEWRPYEHRVLVALGERLLPMPINRTTINRLYDMDLSSEAEMRAFLISRAETIDPIRTSRDVVVSQVGEELYRLFFEGYTRKQWGLDASQLDKSVAARLPTRETVDDRYFLDRFQAMPLNGYTRLFENMLDHDRIRIELGVDYQDVKSPTIATHTIFTGPIDEYFGHRFGALPYRSLAFRHETLDRRRFQPVAVVNYPDAAVPYTRTTEYKHLTGQVHRKTSISYETPQADGDPYYPIPRPENEALYRRYADLAAECRDVTFAGRLGTYRYYNMDQVVGQALATYRRLTQTVREAAAVEA